MLIQYFISVLAVSSDKRQTSADLSDSCRSADYADLYRFSFKITGPVWREYCE